MTKLGIKKTTKTDSEGKQAAIDDLTAPDNYLKGETHKARFDIDKRLNRSLIDLGNRTESVEELPGNRIKTLSVTGRMLLTEAIIDLLDKYEQGNGNYPFENGQSFNWERE